MNKIKALLTKEISTFLVRKISSFTYLNVTQFLGALNDNIYKLLIVFFLIQLEGVENSTRILALSGFVFVLPFLIFSASSGTLADRFSKRNIIIFTKFLEIVVMAGAIFAFSFESKTVAYSVLFLLAMQSAIFGPSKYGIIPELVKTEKISQANGLMTTFTFLAIIIGTFCASFILDITGKNFILAAIFCFTLSIIGLITSFCLEYTPPSGSFKRFNIFFLSEIYQTLKTSLTVPSLFPSMLGAAFFLFLGAFAQLNIIPFAMQHLNLTDIQGGYLFLLLALGIGTGSLVAAKISGSNVELGLIPLAGAGITFSCFFMDIFSNSFILIIFNVIILGFLGGMYQVPLDSYIQIASPDKKRGQIVAATNFLSFFGVMLASIMLYFISEVFGYGAAKGFSVMGTITLVVTIVYTFQFYDYLSRFIAMILSKLHFKTIFSGHENIPTEPAIYICTHTAWNDTLLMLGAQNRRMRFFVEEEQDHSKWMKKLYKMLKIVNIPLIDPLENNEKSLKEIKELLMNDISVCIFVENPDICQEFEKLNKSFSFQELLKGTNFPIIPVSIEKGTKEKEAKFFKRLYNKLHVPASVSFGSLVCENN